MPPRARASVGGALLATLLLAAACAVPAPSPPPTGSGSPVPSRPAAARPYDTAAVLAAMAASRRPGGVPEELETPAVAAQVADAVWTYDGRPYPTLVVGGSCGPSSCTLEVSGQPADAAGADVYVFAVARPSGAVSLTTSDLHGYPSGLDPTIERVARDGVPAGAIGTLAYASASWQLPPRSGWFLAAFRSGGEEGSPGLDVLVDLPARTVVSTSSP